MLKALGSGEGRQVPRQKALANRRACTPWLHTRSHQNSSVTRERRRLAVFAEAW